MWRSKRFWNRRFRKTLRNGEPTRAAILPIGSLQGWRSPAPAVSLTENGAGATAANSAINMTNSDTTVGRNGLGKSLQQLDRLH
jgi:hypothetical protein